jgi:hypothetical protein
MWVCQTQVLEALALVMRSGLLLYAMRGKPSDCPSATPKEAIQGDRHAGGVTARALAIL